MDVHLLTPRGDLLVVRVVDGKVLVPPAPADRITPADYTGNKKGQ